MSTASVDPRIVGASDTQLAILQRETPKDEIKYRAALSKGGAPVMRAGKPLQLAYVDARYVQDTFDEAVGPSNWQSRYEDTPNGTRCGIGVRIDRGDGASDWVWKWDAGSPSNIEPVKGSHSDAFKRAGVHWGVARDLYDSRLDTPSHVPEDVDASHAAPAAAERPPVLRARTSAATAPAVRTLSGPADPGTGELFEEALPFSGGDTADWECPVHGGAKVVPAGISKRGYGYASFYACTLRECDEKGPSFNDKPVGPQDNAR